MKLTIQSALPDPSISHLVHSFWMVENKTGKHTTIEAAINNYEQQMLVYATEAQLETSRNEIAMSLPDFSFLKFYQ